LRDWNSLIYFARLNKEVMEELDFGFGDEFSVKITPQQTQENHTAVQQVESKTTEMEISKTEEIEYFSQEFSRGLIALAEEYCPDPFASLDTEMQQKQLKFQTVALFGFPFEIPGEYEMERRIGIELGPEKVYYSIKSSSLRAIKDANAKYYEFLSNLPPPGAITLEETSTIERFFSDTLAPFNRIIGFGGANSLLNTYFAHIDRFPQRNIDYMIKISPKLSRKPLPIPQISKKPKETDEADPTPPPKPVHNNNYVTALEPAERGRLIHFGVLDNEASQSEFNSVTQEDKSRVYFLDKRNKTNITAFTNLLSDLKADLQKSQRTDTSTLRLGLMLDCESIQARYVTGVSCPAIFGLTHQEIQSIFELCLQPGIDLRVLLLTNYNPAIEMDRSARFLTLLLHNFLQLMKDSRQSPA
jgi:hypothetical protein